MDKIPVWIQLHNVPLEYWTVKGLSHLASAVGVPLFADYATENCKRVDFAKICVELDAAKPLVKYFEVATLQNKPDTLTSSAPNSFSTIRVTYQWKPLGYIHCVIFGHSLESFLQRDKEKQFQGSQPVSPSQ